MAKSARRENCAFGVRHLFPLASLAVLITPASVLAQGATGDAPSLFRNPTINKTQIVFEYANDLWSAPRAGGAASRLTAGPGVERNPVFSPDGEFVAFTGQYDGSSDVFVVPAAGGVPKRLTWHPGLDLAVGWTPDSKQVVFASAQHSHSPSYAKLFTVPAAGGPESPLPLPSGYEAAYSPDGMRLAYVPLPRAFTAWKRYRGGRTTPVWIADLATSKIEKVPRDNSNDFCPMWLAGKVWFLSDREGPASLFSYDPQSKRVSRALENRGLDFKSASAGPDAIVIEQFGSLHLFDPKSSRLTPIRITLSGDLTEVRERFVNVSKSLSNPAISPTGARAVFEARGEILTVPAEKGDPRNLTNSTGVHERFPSWSPDGKSIAYFSDASGEYELHIAPHDGVGEVKKIRVEEKPSFYLKPVWSPDSKKIAFGDAHLQIWVADLAAGKASAIDKNSLQMRPPTPVWSPDSQWLAYTKALPNYMGAIFVFNLADGRATQVTDGLSDAQSPVWDRNGKYLYFTASTDSGPSLQPDLQSAARPSTASIYLVVLTKSEPSPFSPESDEEKPTELAKSDPPKPPAGIPSVPAAAVVKIDFDNILQRVLSIPMPARRYTGLVAGKSGTLLALEAPAALAPGPIPLTVHRFDLKERRADVPYSGVTSFQLAENGEKALYQQGTN